MTATAKTPKFPRLTPLEALERAAECLRVLAHPHRLRMIQMLLRGRYTVGELAAACAIRTMCRSPRWPTSVPSWSATSAAPRPVAATWR